MVSDPRRRMHTAARRGGEGRSGWVGTWYGSPSLATSSMPRLEEVCIQPSQQRPRIIHHDDDILVVNKPAGLAVHGWSVSHQESRPGCSCPVQAIVAHPGTCDTCCMVRLLRLLKLVTSQAQPHMARVAVWISRAASLRPPA